MARRHFPTLPNYVLGRNKSGTLQLIEDDKGLLVRIKPPDTQWAKDLQKSIERGDISQMSFGFVVEEDKWSSHEGKDVRELKKVKLYDVSPVTYPAYNQTDVGVRAMERYKEYRSELEANEGAKQEAENKAKAKQKIALLKAKYTRI